MANETWRKALYSHNIWGLPSDKSHVTCDGHLVRSRVECIVYNELMRLGVPFRYEETICLAGPDGETVKVNADFVIRRPDGQEVILEYLGMIGDDEYLLKNAEKFRLYINNGYRLNDTLFYLTDNAGGFVDSRLIVELVQKMIMKR